MTPEKIRWYDPLVLMLWIMGYCSFLALLALTAYVTCLP